MIKKLFRKRQPDFASQEEVDVFVNALGDKYLRPLGFKAYSGRKWVAQSDDRQFFKVISFPLLAGHYNYSPVLSYALPFVPNLRTLLNNRLISLSTTASTAKVWHLAHVPYWLKDEQVAGLSRQSWLIRLRYEKQSLGKRDEPRKDAIEAVFRALHQEAGSYFADINTLSELKPVFSKAANKRDKHYFMISGFGETIATFQLAYALLLKKLDCVQEANKEYRLFSNFLKKYHHAEDKTLAVLDKYFSSLN